MLAYAPRPERRRLQPRFAQGLDAGRPQPLRELALGRDKQGLMRERRCFGAQCSEHLQLDGAVRDMVLAAHNVGDLKVDVVDLSLIHI